MRIGSVRSDCCSVANDAVNDILSLPSNEARRWRYQVHPTTLIEESSHFAVASCSTSTLSLRFTEESALSLVELLWIFSVLRCIQ